jgi:polar amino acid transport system substrate-binding protein
MKKFLALLMASALVLSMAACGSSESAASSAAASSAASAAEEETAAAASAEETTEAEEPAEAADETSETITFTVGFDAEYPPYGYMDENGEYVGFDLDLAQEVCDRNGWTLVKQPIDWDAKDMELNSGSIDCIWNGFTMTGREDSYTFSVPYVDNSIVFVVMNDSDIQSAADLAGKIVVTQADSSALAALTDEEDNQENLDLAATFADLQQVADYNTAFLNLESGVVDAIAVDIGVAQYQLTSRGDTFRMLEEPLSTEQYGIGFKLGNEELRDAVQATLFEMYKDGTVDEIAAKYADYNLPDMLCLGNYVD